MVLRLLLLFVALGVSACGDDDYSADAAPRDQSAAVVDLSKAVDGADEPLDMATAVVDMTEPTD